MASQDWWKTTEKGSGLFFVFFSFLLRKPEEHQQNSKALRIWGRKYLWFNRKLARVRLYLPLSVTDTHTAFVNLSQVGTNTHTHTHTHTHTEPLCTIPIGAKRYWIVRVSGAGAGRGFLCIVATKRAALTAFTISCHPVFVCTITTMYKHCTLQFCLQLKHNKKGEEQSLQCWQRRSMVGYVLFETLQEKGKKRHQILEKCERICRKPRYRPPRSRRTH